MTHALRLPAYLLAVSFLLLCAGGRVAGQGAASRPSDTPDREYTLQSAMLGYRGVGGEIDGVRNPTLWARRGETVRITIVNAELMVHDVALDRLKIKSTEILDKGATASITFKAEASDTYFCSLPGHRAAGMEGRLEVSDGPRPSSEGVAVEVNGRTLNLDFESGTLEDWTATGDAFDLVSGPGAAAGADQGAGARGQSGTWSVSSGTKGSPRRGTLSSAPFRVTHPFASFLVSGGAFASTRVEIVTTEDRQPIYTISGADSARLRPAVVDLRSWAGKEIFIRLVDDETGAPTAVYLKESPWAHINFDRFRLHDVRPFFPDEITPSDISMLPPMDTVAHAGLSGVEAARAMTVPEGFTVTLAAAEPDIVRPIAFTHDDRGRLWVAEAHTYPVRASGSVGRDRILVFEDTDGDGRLDSRKVFTEGLNLVSGLEIGFGGLFVGAAPNLLFIPIKEGEDVPAGPPQILLDGWGYQDTHEMLNTFTWGPDGWLYGTHGVFTHSNVGAPGAPDSARQRLNGAIWRFHPTTRRFEVFGEGTSNPWGLDFNDYGHAFTTACVIEHLYHVIPGARYKRQAGKHFNPFIYDDVKTIADHVHWVGRKGPHAGNGRSDAAGGGHAHSGAMIYLGGDGWPAGYRRTIFMNNIHGARTNTDRLERAGSGYTASHGPDFLKANDTWSQMLNFRYGPDGSVHAIDWYDRNQCHSSNPDVHEKSLGRIFRISHASDRPVRVDLQREPSSRLVEMQLHRNDWYVRHARRILQERGPDPKVHAALREILRTNPDVTRKLRALWALHVTGGLGDRERVELLGHDDEYVRSWAVQLIAEDRNPSDAAIRRFAAMARQDASALVRLYLAAALQRVPPAKRWDVVAGLLGRQEDAGDQNQPLMAWWAAEPLAALDAERALALAAGSRLPRTFSFMVQRVAALGTQDALRILSERMARTTVPAEQLDLLAGISQIVKPPAAPAQSPR